MMRDAVKRLHAQDSESESDSEKRIKLKESESKSEASNSTNCDAEPENGHTNETVLEILRRVNQRNLLEFSLAVKLSAEQTILCTQLSNQLKSLEPERNVLLKSIEEKDEKITQLSAAEVHETSKNKIADLERTISELNEQIKSPKPCNECKKPLDQFPYCSPACMNQYMR